MTADKAGSSTGFPASLHLMERPLRIRGRMMLNPYTVAEEAFAQLSRLLLTIDEVCDEFGTIAVDDDFPQLIEGSDFKHYLIDKSRCFRLDDLLPQLQMLGRKGRECATIFNSLPVRPLMQSAYRDKDVDRASYSEVLLSITSTVIDSAQLFLGRMNVLDDGDGGYYVAEPEPPDAFSAFWPEFVRAIVEEELSKRLGALEPEIQRELRFAAGVFLASLPVLPSTGLRPAASPPMGSSAETPPQGEFPLPATQTFRPIEAAQPATGEPLKVFEHGVTIDEGQHILRRRHINKATDPLPMLKWQLVMVLLKAGEKGILLRDLLSQLGSGQDDNGAIRTAISELRGLLQKIDLTITDARGGKAYKIKTISTSAGR